MCRVRVYPQGWRANVAVYELSFRLFTIERLCTIRTVKRNRRDVIGEKKGGEGKWRWDYTKKKKKSPVSDTSLEGEKVKKR